MGDRFLANKSFQKMKFLKGHSAEKIQVKNTKIVKGKVLSMFLSFWTLVLFLFPFGLGSDVSGMFRESGVQVVE